MEETYEETHPAFGLASFSRISTNAHMPFFGASTRPEHYIEMKIMAGAQKRSLSSDRYREAHPRKTYIAVRMTPVQFSEMITNMNMGSGVPVTIEQFDDEAVEPLVNYDNRIKAIEKTFKIRMRKFAERLKEYDQKISTLLEKTTLSKADRDSIKNMMHMNNMEIEKNLPYFTKCFTESAEKISNEVMSNLEAAIMGKITGAGLDALGLSKEQFIGINDQQSTEDTEVI